MSEPGKKIPQDPNRFDPPDSEPCLYSARRVICSASESINQGSMLVHHGRIIAIGARNQFDAKPDFPEFDLGDVALAPGLINAHCHLRLGECLDQFRREPFEDWLPRMIARSRKLTPEEVRSGTVSGLRQLAASGVTSVVDTASESFAVFALEESGLRYFCLREVISVAPPPYESLLSESEHFLNLAVTHSRGTLGIAPHAPYTVSRPLMEALRTHFCGKREVPFSMHIAECASEEECLTRQTGPLAAIFHDIGFYPAIPSLCRSPLEFAQAGCATDEGTDLLVHGNYLAGDAMATLADEGRSVLVVCPGTREFHCVTTPVAERAIQCGLPLALGTDSLASNNALNLWVEMRRFLKQNPGFTSSDAFETATIGGARAMGKADRLGRLKVGYLADCIAIELDDATRDLPLSSLIDHWIADKEGPRILESWVGGRPLSRRPILGETAMRRT